jgi:glutathione peroxidase
MARRAIPVFAGPIVAIAALLAAGPVQAQAQTPAPAAAAACPELLHQRLPRLQDEKPIDLCSYSGKVLLVVNTASYCGFTPQYKTLEALHQRYASRGLVVLGFPSNAFSQEPGSNEAIADFCENTFSVRFPMFAKSSVRAGTGVTVNPLYVALAAKTGQAPRWNFHKYLISRDGRQVISRPSATDPSSPDFVREVEKLLADKPE